MSLAQLLAQITRRVRLPSVENRQNKSEQEKNRGEPAGDLGEDVGGLGAENILGDAATKSRAQAFALRALHQDDEHHEERVQDVNPEEDIDEQGHLGRAISPDPAICKCRRERVSSRVWRSAPRDLSGALDVTKLVPTYFATPIYVDRASGLGCFVARLGGPSARCASLGMTALTTLSTSDACLPPSAHSKFRPAPPGPRRPASFRARAIRLRRG